MLILISIVILLLAPGIMGAIHAIRPGFASLWLVAALAALVAWPLILFADLSLPQEIPLLQWPTTLLFASSPALWIDKYSWPLALAVASLLVAVIFTAAARARQGSWVSWASSCILAALSLIAVFAANPLTLLLAWAAIDFTELIILFSQVYSTEAREQIGIAFSMRAGGIFFLIWSGVTAYGTGEWQAFDQIPPTAKFYMLLAASLRLGVLPLNLSFLREIPLRRGLGVSLLLIPAASSLGLLVRLANGGETPALFPLLLGLAAIAALYGAIRWFNEPDELSARPYWLIGISSFAVASALLVQPASALAWSLICILSGGLIFLGYVRHRAILPLRVLGVLAFTLLPYTPGWNGAGMYFLLNPIWLSLLLVIFLIAHGLFLAGAYLKLFNSGEALTGFDRWIRVIYPLGLAVLPGTHILVSWRAFPAANQVHTSGWLGGFIVTGMSVLLVFIKHRQSNRISFARNWKRFFSFSWFYGFLWMIFLSARRVVDWISIFLEGESGILWALLLLALLISIFVSSGAGG